MKDANFDIRVSQENYYRNLLANHEKTPLAVSSESYEHKSLRFKKIAGVFADEKQCSVHDVGVGLADFAAYLQQEHPEKVIAFSGSDILNEYVVKSGDRFPNSKFYCRDLSQQPGNDRYDYLVLSGVFHQRRDCAIGKWEDFMERLLINCWTMSNRGIAFNVVSQFVDYYQPGIHYCNLHRMLTFVSSRLSRFFEIHHDYALYEATIYVYRPEWVRSRYLHHVFDKYFKE